eukprot:748446-Hanusia_phi.AAC.1
MYPPLVYPHGRKVVPPSDYRLLRGALRGTNILSPYLVDPEVTPYPLIQVLSHFAPTVDYPLTSGIGVDSKHPVFVDPSMAEERIMHSLERLERLYGALERQDSMTSFMLDALDVLALSVSAEAQPGGDETPTCTVRFDVGLWIFGARSNGTVGSVVIKLSHPRSIALEQSGVILSSCSIGCIMDGSPAMDCGKLSVGDVIVKVDGQDVNGKNIEEAMRGCDLPGSLLWLTVRKPDGRTDDVLMHRIRVSDMFQRTRMVQALARLRKAVDEDDTKTVSASAADVHQCWQKHNQESLRSQKEVLESVHKIQHGLKNWLIDWKKEISTLGLLWRDAFYEVLGAREREDGVRANDIVRLGNKALTTANQLQQHSDKERVRPVRMFDMKDENTTLKPAASPNLSQPLDDSKVGDHQSNCGTLDNFCQGAQNHSSLVQKKSRLSSSNEEFRKPVNGERQRLDSRKQVIADPLIRFEEANASMMENVLAHEILGVILKPEVDMFAERARVVDIMPGSLVFNQKKLCVGDIILSIDSEKIISVDHAEFCLKAVLSSRKRAVLDVDRKGCFHKTDIDARGTNSKHFLLTDRDDEELKIDRTPHGDSHSSLERTSVILTERKLLEIFKSKEHLLEG